MELNNVNGCNDISFGDHSILEGDRIPRLKSHGQALEEELCFAGVLSDDRDTPANLLRHFYGCLMPCTCCLDCRKPVCQRICPIQDSYRVVNAVCTGRGDCSTVSPPVFSSRSRDHVRSGRRLDPGGVRQQVAAVGDQVHV